MEGKVTAPERRKLPVSVRESPKLKMEVKFCGVELEKGKKEMIKKDRSVSFMVEKKEMRGGRLW